MNLEELSDPDMKNLSKIYKQELKGHSLATKTKIYSIYLNKMQKLNDFLKIYYIFGLFTVEKEYIDPFINKIWTLFDNEKKPFDNENIEAFYYVLFLIKKNNEEKALEFLQNINKIQDNEIIINIYEKILSKKELLNIRQKNVILDFYLNKPLNKELKLENTYSFLLEYFQDKKIEMDDFYKTSNDILSIFKIFNYLNTKKEFEKKNFYFNSFRNFTNFINSIKNNEISLTQLKNLVELIKTPEFSEKIDCFNYSKKNKTNLFKEIESKYKFILDKREKLEKCKRYLDNFPSSEDTKLKNILSLNLKELEKPLKKFIKALNEENFSNKLEKLYERSLKYDKIHVLKTSTIFLAELENRVDKEKVKMNYLENKINDMKQILSPSTIKNIDKNIFNDFLSLFDNEKDLLEEIDKLKEYFKIKTNTTIIEKYLIYKLKYFK